MSLAAAVSLALLAGLATFGGLGYAATSIANVGRTASHVVVPQHQGPATPTRENSSNDGNSSNGQSNGQSSSKGHDQNGESGDDEDDNDESSAHSQYDLEIVCVLVFPGTKYEHILRLPRFLVPFFLAHHPDAVVVTCPVRRNSG